MAKLTAGQAWFSEARFGVFIHWVVSSLIGRGEQALFREHLDPAAYEKMACGWDPKGFDPHEWARVVKESGAKYAVMVTRHHDGFCMWDSRLTDYSTARQKAGRDFVHEYVEAFRVQGIRIGLYYSLADWRVPAYWDKVENDPKAWDDFVKYVHGQVRELLADYGKIDVMWFDGAWPHNAAEWRSEELIKMIRGLQPDILINNRLGAKEEPATPGGEKGPGETATLGDFGTPERQVTAVAGRVWEACDVSTWRLWGYTRGERWKNADVILDLLTDAASKGGNFLLNVGPDADGRFPKEFVAQMRAIGEWMKVHGECVYGSERGDVTESVTYGKQIVKGNDLYLVFRFWPGVETFRVAGLANKVMEAVLLTTGKKLEVENTAEGPVLKGLPVDSPTALFPVIRLRCDGPPAAGPQWAKERLWSGDPRRMLEWARNRGTGVNALK